MGYCAKCGQKFRLFHICTAEPPRSGKERQFCPKCGTLISEKKWFGDYRGWSTGACPKCHPEQAYYDDDA